MKYLAESYDDMICKSYAYSKEEQDSSSDWKTMRELYQNNYIQYTDTLVKIPKIIHQVWLGSPFPEKYWKYTESWKKFHPDWKYKLWTDLDAKRIHITRRDIFDNASNNGMRSDILRYEILRQYGGLYVDTDFECLKSFDDLMYLDFFASIGYDTKLQLYIGLIASIPDHPIISECANSLNYSYNGCKGSKIMEATGANHFTRCFLEKEKESKNVVAFPMDFFYPFPNNLREENVDVYSFITPCSYAIHHWAVSWLIKK